MDNFLGRFSKLVSAVVSAAGLSVASVLLCALIGFFEGFSSEQWGFWLWFAALWPFGSLAILATYFFVTRERDEISN
ncbi:hypothetical protein [Vibrio sp. LaRot3]|uniref:hypothetical protein n=1 Tax=Vibrio sp. LaRot3 TaxID=2998829 RepID=UPI0022CE17FB|nr:hypothetical protein [Vibrio sp. LaRot3]MDA0148836.1 hypothetical protein [Vibrio sp. LaRot3]